MRTLVILFSLTQLLPVAVLKRPFALQGQDDESPLSPHFACGLELSGVQVYMNLTDHFTDTEMGVAGADQRLIDNARFLCQVILEPIQGTQFGPLHIHDGYRSPEHNAKVGGKPTSWHQFDTNQAAADFDCLPHEYVTVFDWIRLWSGLPFDKVILERNSAGNPAAIHIQVDTTAAPRRLAYTGSTGAGTTYTPQVVA